MAVAGMARHNEPGGCEAMSCELGENVGAFAVRPIPGTGEIDLAVALWADQMIAHEAKDALNWNVLLPHGRVSVAVANGWLTLGGLLDWQYQRDAAVRAVRHLPGVKGVTNRIVLRQPDLSLVTP
jgi:hypothetical protein